SQLGGRIAAPVCGRRARRLFPAGPQQRGKQRKRGDELRRERARRPRILYIKDVRGQSGGALSHRDEVERIRSVRLCADRRSEKLLLSAQGTPERELRSRSGDSDSRRWPAGRRAARRRLRRTSRTRRQYTRTTRRGWSAREGYAWQILR